MPRTQSTHASSWGLGAERRRGKQGGCVFSDSTRQQDKPNVAQKTPCRKVPGYLSVGPSARSQNMGLGQMSGEQRNGVDLKPGAYRGSHRKACPLATCLQLQNGQRANSKQWFPVNPKTLRATPPSSRPRLQHPHFFGFLLLPNSALLRNGAGPGLVFHLFNAEKYTHVTEELGPRIRRLTGSVARLPPTASW